MDRSYEGYPDAPKYPEPGMIDTMIPSLLETSILGLVILYIFRSIVVPILVDDRSRWFAVIEKLTGSIDRLADKFEEIEHRIDRIEDKLK